MVVVGGPVPMSQLSCLHGVERRAGLGMGPALQLSHPQIALSLGPRFPLCADGARAETEWVPSLARGGCRALSSTRAPPAQSTAPWEDPEQPSGQGALRPRALLTNLTCISEEGGVPGAPQLLSAGVPPKHLG